MPRFDDSLSLSALARLGFVGLSTASAGLRELAEIAGVAPVALIEGLRSADPDEALAGLIRVGRRDPAAVAAVLGDEQARSKAWAVFGASPGLGRFFERRPEQLAVLREHGAGLPTGDALRAELLAAVGAEDGFAASGDAATRIRLRVAYRRAVVGIAVWDLAAADPVEAVAAVSSTLADAAAAALEAALAVARTVVAGASAPARRDVALTRLAIIGMGKTGARELNYVSDVDVIYVAGTADEEQLSEARAIDIATRLARETMQVLSGIEAEPPLWEVDAALRPEGKQGALVRSLASHVAYYDRWAKS